MKQATMIKPGHIVFGEKDAPSPGPGQVSMHIHRIGVCGSDVHVWHGRHPFTTYPVVQGHEFSATVAEIGRGVAGLQPGMKITATPQETCGECRPCRRGDYNICTDLKVWGFQTDGVAQDFFVTSADKIVPLPDSFSFEKGAFVEPCAVAVHATGRAGDLRGHNTVVVGAGPIGNLMAQAAKARGANVLITDISDHRLRIAQQCGIVNTSNPKHEPLPDAVTRVFGGAFDRAFECVGAEPTMNSLIESMEKGGTIMVVGVFGERPRLNMAVAGEHELSLAGTLMYRKPDYEQAVKWISDGDLRVDPLESVHFGFADYPQAYRFIDAQGEKAMKVFIDVND